MNISNLHVIKICRNKKLSQKFFEDNGIGAPKEIPFNASSAEVKYPVFIKPLDGSSSINTFKAGNGNSRCISPKGVLRGNISKTA